MGDRVSISFRDATGESPVFFNHWGGVEFAERALAWARDLSDRKQGAHTMPLDRLECGTVMVDFIRETTKGMPEVDSVLYLEREENGGDNSDNGHYCIVLDKDPTLVRFEKGAGRVSNEMVRITIETDNAAFENTQAHETRRILLKLCEELESTPLFYLDGKKLLDVNGNSVGIVRVS